MGIKKLMNKKRLPAIIAILLLLMPAFMTTVVANGESDAIVTVTPDDPTAAQTTDYGITFTTNSSGTVAVLEIIFPDGFDLSGVELDAVVNIGDGTLFNPSNTQTIVYEVTNPVVIPAGRVIALQLTNIVNINTAGNYTVTAVSGTFFGILDGPSDSGNFTINPTLTVNPEEGAVETEVEIEGAYFGAYKEVTLTFDDEVIETLTTDEVGGFSTTYTIDTSIGYDYYFNATNEDGFFAEAEFYLRSPDIDLDQHSGIPNMEVVVSGDGFASDSNVDVFWELGGATETLLATATTNSSGSFENVTFTVPDEETGYYEITAVDMMETTLQTRTSRY